MSPPVLGVIIVPMPVGGYGPLATWMVVWGWGLVWACLVAVGALMWQMAQEPVWINIQPCFRCGHGVRGYRPARRVPVGRSSEGAGCPTAGATGCLRTEIDSIMIR